MEILFDITIGSLLPYLNINLTRKNTLKFNKHIEMHSVGYSNYVWQIDPASEWMDPVNTAIIEIRSLQWKCYGTQHLSGLSRNTTSSPMV